ncbi:hypothetical protein JCM11251_000293 [Rhodosporidiobolus azoricus]
MQPPPELVKGWTAEQHRQATAASFTDSATLSFALNGVSSAVLPSDRSRSPAIHREDIDSLSFEGLTAVGGLDISFRDSSGDEGIAVLAVLSFPDLKPLHTLTRRVDLSTTPYVHSYLSFREADHYVSLLDELRATPGAVMPQVLLVDGNGRWHPRQAGSAVAVGVKTGIPTIGIAKEYHPISPSSILPPPPIEEPTLPFPTNYYSSQKSMRKACQVLLKKRGDWLGLLPPEQQVLPMGEVGKVAPEDNWGAALFSSPSRTATNPIFVSSGHLLSLPMCVRVALACSKESKVPEPVRRADAVDTPSRAQPRYELALHDKAPTCNVSRH